MKERVSSFSAGALHAQHYDYSISRGSPTSARWSLANTAPGQAFQLSFIIRVL